MLLYATPHMYKARLGDDELRECIAKAKTCPVAMKRAMDACTATVYSISSKMIAYCSWGIDQADIIQEGLLEISEKIKRTDMSHIQLINGYLYGVANNAMRYFVFRNSTTLHITDSKDHSTRRAFWKIRSTIDRLGSFKAACQELRITEDVGHHVLMALRGTSQILEYEVDDDEPRLVASEFDLEAVIDEEQAMTSLKSAIKKLDARKRDIIEKRYFGKQPMKYEDIAKIYGVSHQRIQQLENDAIKIMQIG